MVAVSLAIELLILIIVGVLTAKLKIVNDSFPGQLTNFLMKIVIPSLIIISITAKEFSVEQAGQCIVALAAGFFSVGLSVLIGHLLYLISGKSGIGRLIRYGLSFTHFSYMGIPIINALFGDTGNLYYVMFLVPVRIFFYLLSPQLMGQKRKRSSMDALKNIVNPCMVAVVIGLIFWIGHIPLPEIIYYCLNSLNKTCSPLGLVLCGLIIGKYKLKEILKIQYLRLPLLRTVFVPALFFGLTRFLILMGIDPLICNMMVIYSALPCAQMTAILAVQYKEDQSVQFEAAGSVFIAIFLSAITIPAWYYVIELTGSNL